MSTKNNEVLLSLEDICKYFKVSGGTLKAVDHVSFDIHKGETMGLVGESGCGKSTLGRVAMGIYPPTHGKLTYKGKQVNLKHAKDRFNYSKVAQIIFQDPYASLDPRMTVSSIIQEGMEIHNMYDAKRRKERVYELLEMVGLNREHANRFPHEFSGGQRQRIGIARALAIEPEFIVCDEPISALDVSIQSQVINLLAELQERLGLTYLFIAHDLNIVKYISDRIAVMYLGNVVELASSDELYQEHPAPLFPGPAVGRAHPGPQPGGPEAADHHFRRRAQPHQHPQGLQLCRPLPQGLRPVQREQASPAGDHSRPLCGLPSGAAPKVKTRVSKSLPQAAAGFFASVRGDFRKKRGTLRRGITKLAEKTGGKLFGTEKIEKDVGFCRKPPGCMLRFY